MKEFVITERRTAIQVWTYSVMAENEIDALNQVKEGNVDRDDILDYEVIDIGEDPEFDVFTESENNN
jgi:hypothetical protein